MAKSEKVAMYKNQNIPKFVRIGIPSMLFMNLILFIYGDLGVSVKIGLEGTLFGAPILLKDFASFSVLSSTRDLFENGAVGLAILITILAIIWPYFKLLSLTICYFTNPNCLVLKFRGKYLHFLDAFGKYSMIELFFVIFLRLVFELNVGTPKVGFLPEEDLYNLQLLITPQASYYTFASAVVISIFVSNVMVVYHEKILRENENELLRMMIKDVNQDLFIKHAVYDWDFKVDNSHKEEPNYKWSITTLGNGILLLLAFAIYIMIFFAAGKPVVEVKYIGLAKLFLELEQSPTSVEFSVFSISKAVYNEALEENDAGGVFLVFTFVITLIIVPLALTFMLQMMHLKRFTLNSARKFKDYTVVVGAWSALEVFILAIAVSVIEVPEIAGYLTGDSCDFLTEFMEETLLPLGMVSEEDVRATCFGIKINLREGAYVFLILIALMVLLSALTMGIFSSFIKQRRTYIQRERKYFQEREYFPLDREALAPVRLSKKIWLLKKLKLVKAFRTD